MSIHPTYKYRDAKAAIDFLERAFGFERKEVHEATTARSSTPSCASATAS
jgi:uncharacterized glyoxalase superfamily protein PhnB